MQASIVHGTGRSRHSAVHHAIFKANVVSCFPSLRRGLTHICRPFVFPAMSEIYWENCIHLSRFAAVTLELRRGTSTYDASVSEQGRVFAGTGNSRYRTGNLIRQRQERSGPLLKSDCFGRRTYLTSGSAIVADCIAIEQAPSSLFPSPGLFLMCVPKCKPPRIARRCLILLGSSS
jgi:hypothetical protein